MADITLRLTKGSPLTNLEIDTNFTNLNTELGTKLAAADLNAEQILTLVKSVDGTGSGLDADTVDGFHPLSTNTNNAIVLRDASGNFAANVITAVKFEGIASNIDGLLSINNGGTGGASQAQALNNLLPAGATNGYVLKTSGPGSYYWGAETGATQQSGTRINTTRDFYTAIAGQTVFSGVSTYTPGAGQLRVYINGVRQFNSAYFEISPTSFTLTEGVPAGTQIMAEVDGYVDYNITATDVDFTPVSTLSSTNVQAAISELLNELSPFIVPSGGIIIWSGAQAAIPSGWVLCNGSAGTPDLRDRFVIGAGSTHAVNATGGTKDAVVVSHTHGITDPGHVHLQQNNGPDVDTGTLATGAQTSGTQYGSQSTVQSSVSTVSSTTGITINSNGESGVNKNLPPFYALCYIMKL